MTSQSSGGSGSGLPGVTSDGQTPGGVDVAGDITAVGAISGASLAAGSETLTGDFNAGNPAATNVPSFHSIYGSASFDDTPGNNVDGDDVVDIAQFNALTGDSVAVGLQVGRSGALNGHQYTAPAVFFQDTTATTAPVLRVNKQGVTVLELTTQQSITGALASVTDANAKAVLTSIIAALTGIKVAANNTT